MTNPPDRIYLQDYPGNQEWLATWCTSRENDHDIEYMLATPEREAAAEMRAALEAIVNEIQPWNDFGAYNDDGGLIGQARAVLAKARRE